MARTADTTDGADMTTPSIRPGRVFVVEDGVPAIDRGNLADLVRVAGDDENTRRLCALGRCARIIAALTMPVFIGDGGLLPGT
jgi:hypothetical protein